MRRPLGVRIFIGPYGLRSGWRFLVFLCLAVMLLIALRAGMRMVLGAPPKSGTDDLRRLVILLAPLLAIWFMGRVEGKSVWNYGFAAPHGMRNLAAGLLVGFVSLSLLMGLLIAVGAHQLGPAELHGAAVIRWGMYWALFFAGIAFVEESLTRSYALFALTQGIGFWPAAVMLSVVFGLGHQGNSGEDWIGVFNAMLVGLVLAYTVKWTGSLWWAAGYHLTWDWAQSFFYGVADSGINAHDYFLSGQPAGAAWLSGGSVGPEGSVLATPVVLLLIAAVRFTAPRWENPALARLPRVAPSTLAGDAQAAAGV